MIVIALLCTHRRLDGGNEFFALSNVADGGFKAMAGRCQANESFHAASFMLVPTNSERNHPVVVDPDIAGFQEHEVTKCQLRQSELTGCVHAVELHKQWGSRLQPAVVFNGIAEN